MQEIKTFIHFIDEKFLRNSLKDPTFHCQKKKPLHVNRKPGFLRGEEQSSCSREVGSDMKMAKGLRHNLGEREGLREQGFSFL